MPCLFGALFVRCLFVVRCVVAVRGVLRAVCCVLWPVYCGPGVWGAVGRRLYGVQQARVAHRARQRAQCNV